MFHVSYQMANSLITTHEIIEELPTIILYFAIYLKVTIKLIILITVYMVQQEGLLLAYLGLCSQIPA